MNAQQWKKPDFGEQFELRKLNDRLHNLRLEAGLPSARAIRNRIGRDGQDYWIVNHQAVLDAFQKIDLPKWGRLELIVGSLAEEARLGDVAGEVDHFKSMWKRAIREAVAQASVDPQEAIENPAVDEASGAGSSDDQMRKSGRGGANERGEEGDRNERRGGDSREYPFNYAHESLKGLVINATQALWHDKDALNIFLGVVRRSEGFHRMADALGEGEVRPANATFYGVRSGEFEVEYSPARGELVSLHRLLYEHRLKREWSFTDVEKQTGISSDAWIRWYTGQELPDREALVAFSHAAMLTLEDHVLLLGLWEASRDALMAQTRFEDLPSSVTFDEAWKIRGSSPSKLWALAGVGDGGSRAYGPDLSSGSAPAFIVSGPTGSGRSTALVNIVRSLIASGSQVILVVPKPSPLRQLSDRGEVVACFVDPDGQNFREAFEKSLFEASAAGPVVIVVDDGDAIVERDVARLLEGILQRGFNDNVALVLGGDGDELNMQLRWVAQRSHRGLLLSPQNRNAGNLIGIRTGESIIQTSVVPGYGWLHLGDGKLVAVAVPR